MKFEKTCGHKNTVQGLQWHRDLKETYPLTHDHLSERSTILLWWTTNNVLCIKWKWKSDSTLPSEDQGFVELYKISHHIAIVFCLTISQNIFSDIFDWFPCWSFHFTQLVFKFYVLIYSLIWVPTNNPSSILASLILGNLFFNYINPALYWSSEKKKIFWVQIWCATEVIRLFQACHGKAMTSLKFTVVPHPPYSPDLETLLINHPS